MRSKLKICALSLLPPSDTASGCAVRLRNGYAYRVKRYKTLAAKSKNLERQGLPQSWCHPPIGWCSVSLPLPVDATSEGHLDAPILHNRFLFKGFCLDRHSGGLFRLDATGDAEPVTLGSRALDVLSVLLSHPGELLSKQAIMQAVWPGVVIEERNLTVQISALRRVLEDGPTDRSCIQTQAGRGYRFVVPVIRKE